MWLLKLFLAKLTFALKKIIKYFSDYLAGFYLGFCYMHTPSFGHIYDGSNETAGKLNNTWEDFSLEVIRAILFLESYIRYLNSFLALAAAQQ